MRGTRIPSVQPGPGRVDSACCLSPATTSLGPVGGPRLSPGNQGAARSAGGPAQLQTQAGPQIIAVTRWAHRARLTRAANAVPPRAALTSMGFFWFRGTLFRRCPRLPAASLRLGGNAPTLAKIEDRRSDRLTPSQSIFGSIQMLSKAPRSSQVHRGGDVKSL